MHTAVAHEVRTQGRPRSRSATIVCAPPSRSHRTRPPFRFPTPLTPQGLYYTGDAYTLTVGMHDVTSLQLSAVRSVRVARGLVVALCSRAAGGDADHCVTLTSDLPVVQSVVGLDADRIHRIIVTSICSPACAHGDCVGPNQCRCNGLWTGPTCSDCARAALDR